MHLEGMYHIEVPATLISKVTEAMIEEVKQWQGRTLEELYPIVYLDALNGDHQNPRRIPQRRGGAEVTVSGVAASGEEMDHADSSLARSIEPLHDSVARSDTGPGEICTMTTPNASTSMGRGRDALPLHPIQKHNLAVYTKIWTHPPPGDRMSGLSALTIPLNLRPMPRLVLSTDREC